MTPDALIEAMALAIAKDDPMLADLLTPDEMRETARVALRAVTEAGFAVVPVKATEDMRLAGVGRRDAGAPTINIYRAMVAAGRVDGGA